MSLSKRPTAPSHGAQGMIVLRANAQGVITDVALAKKHDELSFTKGGIEKTDASLRHTASRERDEESSIPDDEMLVLPGHLFRELNHKGNPSVTCWASLYVGPPSRVLRPHKGDEVRGCRWYPIAEALVHKQLRESRRAVLQDALNAWNAIEDVNTALVPVSMWLAQEPTSEPILHVQRQPEPAASSPVATSEVHMDAAREEQYSRFLSKVLRHKHEAYGLKMAIDGTISVDALLRLRELRGVSVAELRWIVAHNAKQRFSFDETGLRIRANQGHNQKVGKGITDEKLLTELTEPLPCCVHGTFRKAEKLIRDQGLKCMDRDWIHFAPGLPSDGAVISGMRASAQVWIFVDMAKAMADGIKFFQARNGVIQTRGIDRVLPPAYFQKTLFR